MQQCWWLGLTWALGISSYLFLPRVDTCEEGATLQRVTSEGWGKQNWKAPLRLLDHDILMGFVLNFTFKKGKESGLFIYGKKKP